MLHAERTRTWHVITGEYPPDLGGVADYTSVVAHALAEAGDRVHVWTSGRDGTQDGVVTVHRVFGKFARRDLERAGGLLESCRDAGRVLVQWVPHAFGARGVNVPFSIWLYNHSVRWTAGVDVMIHEPFLPFDGSLRRHAAALAQRLMTAAVLRAADRVFVATPAWIQVCRPLARRVPLLWTPIPSGVHVEASAQVLAFRVAERVGRGDRLIGCFGRAGAFQSAVLEQLAQTLLAAEHRTRLLLIGNGSDSIAARILERRPEVARVVAATGTLDHARLSTALAACDVMVQPYLAGICARHSSAVAILAHGRPMVTNGGRFTEAVWAGAVVLSAAHPPSIVAAAIRLLDDEAEQARLSQAARLLYDQTFDVRHTVAALRRE